LSHVELLSWYLENKNQPDTPINARATTPKITKKRLRLIQSILQLQRALHFDVDAEGKSARRLLGANCSIKLCVLRVKQRVVLYFIQNRKSHCLLGIRASRAQTDGAEGDSKVGNFVGVALRFLCGRRVDLGRIRGRRGCLTLGT